MVAVLLICVPLPPGPPAADVWAGRPAGPSARTGPVWCRTRAPGSLRRASAASQPAGGSTGRGTRAHSAAARPGAAPPSPRCPAHRQTALGRRRKMRKMRRRRRRRKERRGEITHFMCSLLLHKKNDKYQSKYLYVLNDVLFL